MRTPFFYFMFFPAVMSSSTSRHLVDRNDLTRRVILPACPKEMGYPCFFLRSTGKKSFMVL